MSTPCTPYATDEDIALRAPADFALLCPRDQKLAAGSDGAFDGSDRWTLRSDAVDFVAGGLAPGHVVQLLGPVAQFKPPGEALAVAAVAPHALRLRRLGLDTGVGQPPAPPGPLVGVEFLVATLGPQIEDAGHDLDRRFGIDERIAGRRPSDLFDPREVRAAAVLAVLRRRYLDLSRDPSGRGDLFAAKAERADADLGELLARAVLHWSAPAGGRTEATRFSTRLAR